MSLKDEVRNTVGAGAMPPIIDNPDNMVGTRTYSEQ